LHKSPAAPCGCHPPLSAGAARLCMRRPASMVWCDCTRGWGCQATTHCDQSSRSRL